MQTTLPTAYCAACKRDVIVHADLDPSGAWCYGCLRCGGTLDPTEAKRRNRSAKALVAMGYDIDGEAASGGCSSGSCGCSKS